MDKVLLMTRVVFITHLHGDHQLGVLKLMYERDKLLRNLPVDQRTKLYVAIPTPMLDWMELWRTENLKHPELVELVTTNTLNPEPHYFYQTHEYRHL